MAAPNLKSPTTITGKTVGVDLATTNTDIVSNGAASGKCLKVNTLIVANVDGTNSADVTVEYFNGTTGFALLKTVPVPPDSSIDVLSGPLYLEEGTKLRGLANTVNDLQVVASYEDFV